MNLIYYNISNIRFKNIILLGRQINEKNKLLQNILDYNNFDIKYCINLDNNSILDYDLGIRTFLVKDMDNIYNDIINNSTKNKILIIKNFNHLYYNLLNNDNFLYLIKNNIHLNLTIIFVLNNNQIFLKDIYDKLCKFIHILILFSTYFNVDKYIKSLFYIDLNDELLENIIINYIKNGKYVVFHNKSIYYYE